MGGTGHFFASQCHDRFVKLAESNTVIIEKTPDSLGRRERGFLGAGDIFNGAGEWV